MNKVIFTLVVLLAGGAALADTLQGVARMLCATGRAQICFETGECYPGTPWEFQVPDFVLVDTRARTMSTTKASERYRSTPLASVDRKNGVILLQGAEGGRAFSVIVNEHSGMMSAAISTDGMSLAVFGSCTPADL
jgi:hypothetical protein